MSSLLAHLDSYPFKRLATLLDGVAPPSGTAPLLLHIGEPQMPPPPMVAAVIAAHSHLWNKYPPNPGTAEFRAAIADWATRRFALRSGILDPDRHIAPCSGTREGLCVLGQAAIAQTTVARPLVLMPNPFYHSYESAARLSGAEPVFLSTGPESGQLPDLDAIAPQQLQQTAVFFMCSPANPQGVIADQSYLERLVRMARRYGFLVVFDECYSEIYTDEPPPGGLAAAAAVGAGESGDPFDNVIVVNSLSKRSSAPGLRSGFLAGDTRLIQSFVALIGHIGVPTPLPILAAATALWQDEAHVAAFRHIYRLNHRAAATRFPDHSRTPHDTAKSTAKGGFFLWLPVTDGEAVARYLWAKCGIKVMPGSYMARCPGQDSSGKPLPIPGQNYIRVALVYDTPRMVAALDRLAYGLSEHLPARACNMVPHI